MREDREQDLERELRDHLDLEAAEAAERGAAPDEARYAAQRAFGNTPLVKEDVREAWGWTRLEQFLRDVRHAVRRLRLAPAFTGATVLTLALGIGATTSIFTLVHAILLSSLPVANPAELYRMGREAHCCYSAGYSQDKEFTLVSYDLYKYLRDHTGGFSELAAVPSVQALFGVRRAGTSEAARSYPGEFVSGNYFSMFGITAYAGRTFTAEDDRPGATPVVVMSHRLWQERYGSDASIIGGVLNIDEKPVTVVGIAPPNFFGDTLRNVPPDLFMPLNLEPVIQSDADLNKYNTHWLNLIGRIQPGAKPAAIEAEMRVHLTQWLRAHWGEMSANERTQLPLQTLYLTPGGAGITSMREKYQEWLAILMMVSGFVLLIVCANVANLMLVRGMERRRQTSIAMALGARASRIVRQPIIESVLLSLCGGAAGLGIAFIGTRLILQFAFPPAAGVGRVPISASPSMPVIGFAFAISLLTGLAFAIAPAWMATRVDPIEALRGAGRSTSRAGALPRATLVVLQSALSLVLLSGAGLLTAALQRVEHQRFGFEQNHRLVASMNPRLAGYRAAQLSQLYRRIHDSVAAIPGVSSAALCLYSPQSQGGWGSSVLIDGRPLPGPKDDSTSMWDRVTAGYFDVIGTPIVRGRGIAEQDTSSSRKVAVVSEAFARKFFENEDPIGKHFGRTPEASREFEIVGVAKDALYLPYSTQPTRPYFFLPETQAEYAQTTMGSLYLKDIVILTRPGATVSTADLRQAMAAVDPGLPIISVRTLSEQVSSQFTQPRLIARLTSFFGILSLVLASIGLYGVTAYNAGRRVSEIGIRMALGARRGNIIVLVLRGAFGLVSLGLLIGLPLSFAAARLLSSQLYGTSPYNPLVTLASAAALAVSALVASFVPALRASVISPLSALRSE